MRSHTSRLAALVGFAILGLGTAASAQTAEPSMGCRLFPLACPGPVPAPPPPLLGTPEEQAAAEAPPPVRPVRHRAHARKHAGKTADQ